MQIRCQACETHHDLTPTHLRYALLAFQNGDAQLVTSQGIEPFCLAAARQIGMLNDEIDDAA